MIDKCVGFDRNDLLGSSIVVGFSIMDCTQGTVG